MSTTTTLTELPNLKGAELGTSDWIEITQEKVNLFADSTDDHQWIHVDVERANDESPFGGPIAHGRRHRTRGRRKASLRRRAPLPCGNARTHLSTRGEDPPD